MILAVIPARYASSRLPGKPLVDIGGMSMIQRVYKRVASAQSVDKVVVATDDDRIFAHVQSWGGEVVMTRAEHPSGTDRVAEAATHFPEATYILNIQGDEPMLDPGQVNVLCELIQQQHTDIATLVKPLTDPADLAKKSNAKVVLNEAGFALYFSRSPIPAQRDEADMTKWLAYQDYWLHVGLYGFRAEVLAQIPHLPPTAIAQSESLEQLGWLAHGFKIRTGKTTFSGISVDTPEDLARVRTMLT